MFIQTHIFIDEIGQYANVCKCLSMHGILLNFHQKFLLLIVFGLRNLVIIINVKDE